MTNLTDTTHDSAMDQIKELQKKREQAQTLLTRYKTQLETLAQERDNLVKRLTDEFGTTVEDATETLEALKAKRDALLQAAKKSLDMIDL